MKKQEASPSTRFVYTLPEAAEVLRVSARTLRELVYARKIDYVQYMDKAKIQITHQAIMDYLERNVKEGGMTKREEHEMLSKMVQDYLARDGTIQKLPDGPRPPYKQSCKSHKRQRKRDDERLTWNSSRMA